MGGSELWCFYCCKMQRHPDGSQPVTETELTAEIVLGPLTGAANQRKNSNSLQPSPSVSRDSNKCGGAGQEKAAGQAALSWEGEMAFRKVSLSSYEMHGAL